MNSEIKLLVNKCVENPYNFRVFINNLNEIIFDTRANVYFRLEDVETELDFKCKVLEWLSYFCADNHWYKEYNHLSERMEKLINYILGTNFSHGDYQEIYSNLGNCVRHSLTIKFIESGYDMSILRSEQDENNPF